MDNTHQPQLYPNTVSISTLKATLNKFFDTSENLIDPVFVLKNNAIVGAVVSTEFIQRYDQLLKESAQEHEKMVELQEQLRELRLQQVLERVPRRTLDSSEDINRFFDEGGY